MLFLIGFCFNAFGQSKIKFIKVQSFGNEEHNVGQKINQVVYQENKGLLLTGVTSGETDLGLSGASSVVNANWNQDVFYVGIDTSISKTNYSGFLNGNGYDFINATGVNNFKSEVLYGGHFNGTINVLNKSNICNAFGNCGFIAKTSGSGEIADFVKSESTGSLTVSEVKWTSSHKFLVGINYSGTFNHCGKGITATGLTDACLAVYN